MKTRLWCLAVALFALLFVSAAGADEMAFSLSGAGLDASGVLYGDQVSPGQWLVGDASGMFNGSAIVGVWDPANSGNIFVFDNIYYWPEPVVDYAGIVLEIANGELVNLCFDSGCAGAAGTYTAIVWDPVSGIANLNADKYEFGKPMAPPVAPPVATPEPATMLLLGSGIVGAAKAMRRRRVETELTADRHGSDGADQL